MICSNCGADVAPSTGFCRRCGTLVGQPAPLPGSARFTESISVSRYPEYAGYQRETSAVIPWLSRTRHG